MPPRYRRLPLLLLPLLAASACQGHAPLPTPRPLIVFSGARLNAEVERMEEIDAFVRSSLEDIERNPSFLIHSSPSDTLRPIWDAVTLNAAGDTAWVRLDRSGIDALTPFQIYAFLHLMEAQDTLEPWLPEAVGLSGYPLERAILNRISDVWFYGRAIYDAAPYPSLDQLLWAKEEGFMDAFLLTQREDEFPDAAARWREEDPGAEERYRQWFRDTFDREPPAGSGPTAASAEDVGESGDPREDGDGDGDG